MNEFIEYESQEDCESDRIKLRVTEIEVEDLSLLRTAGFLYLNKSIFQ
jgi:hypothetical protein